MPMKSMRDLLADQVKELLTAEMHGVEIYPELAKSASDPKLQQLFHDQAEQSKSHLTRIQSVLDELGLSKGVLSTTESKRMKGLCDDCLDLAHAKNVEPHVRDAALIGMAQHIEHDQIAGYGCARSWSQLLGHESATAVLQKTLDDEHAADTKLTKLAEKLNKTALEFAAV